MRVVRYTASARADITDAISFLEQRAPLVAERLASDLDARIALLASQPLMGRSRDDLSPGLRSSVVGSYILFYRFTDTELRVARVLHGSATSHKSSATMPADRAFLRESSSS